jgi:hypothetical protein
VSKLASTRSLTRRIGAKTLVLWFVLSWPLCYAQETCERAGIEFGFFNGVQTQESVAQRVAEEFLPEQYGLTTPDGQPISYTLYYNDTQAGITDFVETFEQRLQEQDGLLAGRFELFFSAMNGGGSWWSQITETEPTVRSRSNRPSVST